VTGEASVAAADIARLAGVGRAAVSNWRRRFADFPAPVAGTASSPLFRLDEVERWLAEHGRGIDVPEHDRVWQWLRSEVDDLRLGEIVGHLGAFAVFLDRAPQMWTALAAVPDAELADAVGPAVTAAVPELPGGFPAHADPDLLRALRAVAGVVAREGAAPAYRFLAQRYLEAHTRRPSVTPPDVAELMVRLAGVGGRSVLDPACGTGSLLAAAGAGGAAVLAGQEIDPATARLAGALLLLGRIPAELAVDDSLRADAFRGRRFGAVVCTLPVHERHWGYEELAGDPRWEFGLPPRGEPELAWVQHCLAHAEPGATVVVLVPTAAAARRAGRRIRANLLRAGAVRAVIGLPAEQALSLDLWVLCRPAPADALPSHVLVAVAPVSAVAPLWRAYTADPASGNGPNSRAVRVLDLLDEEVDLSPARHVPARPAASADFHRARVDVLSALTALVDRVPALHPVDEPRELPATTLGELAKAGVVTIAQAPLRMATDGGDVPVLMVKDVVENRDPTGRTVEQPGLVWLRDGDVVAPALTGPGAVVRVVTGGAVLGPRLVSVRSDPNRLDAHFLAGHLRVAAAASSRGAAGTGRTDVRRVPIPLLPLAEQRAHGAAFRDLTVFLDTLHAVAAAGEALGALGIADLAGGRLVPGE
jgi:N-6 DNA Methylase